MECLTNTTSTNCSTNNHSAHGSSKINQVTELWKKNSTKDCQDYQKPPLRPLSRHLHNVCDSHILEALNLQNPTVEDGKGVEYFHGRSIIKYIGEFKGGLKHGKGRLYNYFGQLVYEGDFCKDLFHGKGKLYDSMGYLSYKGDFYLNNRQGKGISYHSNGTIRYEGDFERDIEYGQGKLYDQWGNLLFEGKFPRIKFSK